MQLVRGGAGSASRSQGGGLHAYGGSVQASAPSARATNYAARPMSGSGQRLGGEAAGQGVCLVMYPSWRNEGLGLMSTCAGVGPGGAADARARAAEAAKPPTARVAQPPFLPLPKGALRRSGPPLAANGVLHFSRFVSGAPYSPSKSRGVSTAANGPSYIGQTVIGTSHNPRMLRTISNLAYDPSDITYNC